MRIENFFDKRAAQHPLCLAKTPSGRNEDPVREF
jgi:hypothetical protein